MPEGHSDEPDYSILLTRFVSSEQWDRSLETAREWLARDPESYQAHSAAAQALINLSRYAEAEPHLVRVLAKNPDSSTAHRWMSVLRFHQKKLRAADESIQKALSLNPSDTHNWYHLAWMLYKHGDTESARKYALKALELAPRSADTINLVAICTPKNRTNSDVLSRYHEALAIDPEQPAVHNNIGAYRLNVEKNHAAAEKCFRQALYFDPTLKVAQKNLFIVLKHQDRVYRMMCAPKDFIFDCYNATRRLRSNFLLYILTIPLWLLAFRFVLGGLALWFLLVWPMVHVYQYLTIGDIRAQAGEVGARRGGFLFYRRWPLNVRLALFALLLIAFWSGMVWLVSRGPNLGRVGQAVFGLIILIGLLILLVLWIRPKLKKAWNHFFARRRARRFKHLLEQGAYRKK